MASIDFERSFTDCRTVAEANSVFKTLFFEQGFGYSDQYNANYWALMEAHRLAMVRLTIFTAAVATAKSSDPDKIASLVIRNWASKEGLPMGKKGRPAREIENAYREAHDLPSLPDNIEEGSPADIRRWAIKSGIPVPVRGKMPAEVIAKYHAEKGSDQ